MAKDIEIVCKYYSFEGGPCKKRGIAAHFRKECQICSKYCKLSGGQPARKDNRKAKKKRIERKEMNKYEY